MSEYSKTRWQMPFTKQKSITKGKKGIFLITVAFMYMLYSVIQYYNAYVHRTRLERANPVTSNWLRRMKGLYPPLFIVGELNSY